MTARTAPYGRVLTAATRSATAWRQGGSGRGGGGGVAALSLRCRGGGAGANGPAPPPPPPPSGASTLNNATAAAAVWPGLGTPLADLYASVGHHTRVRQHVNPLKRELQVPVAAPAGGWGDWFEDPAAPLIIDAGCGSGRFALSLAASAEKDSNVLGLEIRGALVSRANAWARAATPALDRRVRFVLANATVSLPAGLLATYPGPLSLACFQFPDPHFKARHAKRRILQPSTAAAVAAALAPGGRVFLQSDVLEAAIAMRDAFEAGAGHLLKPCLDLHTESVRAEAAAAVGHTGEDGRPPVSGWAAAGWLPANPLGVPTEREVHSLEQGKAVYRCLMVKR